MPHCSERVFAQERCGVASAAAWIIFGALLVWIGFMLIIPRGESSGSVSHRNVPMGMQGIFQTPGYGHEEAGPAPRPDDAGSSPVSL